ncbi:MAG: S41 family peptidase [Lentisphaerota bacterium]
MHNKGFITSVTTLALTACIACSAQQASTEETMTPRQAEEREIAIRGTLAGIGAKLEKVNDHIAITMVYPGSPAEKAGLKAGQVITAINTAPTGQMTLDNAVSLVRGPKGSQVELTVSDSSTAAPRQVAIVRDIIALPAFTATGKILDGNIGLLTIPSFSEWTPKTVISILQSFVNNGVQGIVLDLRGNGGGSYSAVIEAAGLFTGRKPTLWLKRQGKQAETVHAMGNALWQGPLVVLVDGTTAAGAELLASALQTSDLAKVVGQKTYGKAAFMSVQSQPDGSSKVTVVGNCLTAGGDPIDGCGIKPDVMLDANLSKEETLRKTVEVLSSQKDVKPHGQRKRGSKLKSAPDM